MDAKEVSPLLFLPNRLSVDRLPARRILEVVALVPEDTFQEPIQMLGMAFKVTKTVICHHFFWGRGRSNKYHACCIHICIQPPENCQKSWRMIADKNTNHFLFFGRVTFSCRLCQTLGPVYIWEKNRYNHIVPKGLSQEIVPARLYISMFF